MPHSQPLPLPLTVAYERKNSAGQTTWAGQRLLSAFAALRRLAFGVHAASIELTDEQEIRMAPSAAHSTQRKGAQGCAFFGATLFKGGFHARAPAPTF